MQTTLRAARLATPRLSLCRHASTEATKFKHKAAKDLANDGNKNHTHVTEQTCVLKDCSTIKCSKLCDLPDKMTVKGHHTHKPPVGRIAKFISDYDAHGNKRAQYFVKTNTKQRSITEQEKIQYGKDIKSDPVHKAFIDLHKDKYE